MDIKRATQRPATTGSTDYFTGTVRIDPLVETPAPSRVRAAIVTFEARARTAWHTHPLGQTLYILSGTCLVQKQGEPLAELNTGDVVWFAPGEKHWHGASPQGPMRHLAVHEALDGKTVDWLEQVTDAEFAKRG